MSALVRLQEKAHWYSPDGQPVHEVPNLTKGGLRPTHAGDAKRLGLYPSATNVMSVVSKYGLDQWKIANIVTAAVRTPRAEGEDEETWAQRIYEVAQVEGSDFGTRLHQAVQGFLLKGDWPAWEDPLRPFFEGWLSWFEAQGFEDSEDAAVERSFTNVQEGFGGTPDYINTKRDGSLWLLDWTTQKQADRTKLKAYREKKVTTAAYAKGAPLREWGFEGLKPNVAVVVISSVAPGLVISDPVEGLEWQYDCFRAAKTLFYAIGKGHGLIPAGAAAPL